MNLRGLFLGGRAFSGKKFSPTDNSIVIPVQTHAMCFVPKSPVTLCKIGVLPQSICLVFYISSLILCMEAFFFLRNIAFLLTTLSRIN